jgi:hypothetical protein
LITQFIFISQKDSWTAEIAQMLKHSPYFELISRLMTSANSLNVIKLNLYLSLKKTHGQQQLLNCLSTQYISFSQKDSWTAAMAQILEHSAYFELVTRHMDSSNSSNVKALSVF